MRSGLPPIFISRSDRKRLTRLVSAAYSHKERTAPFLGAELRRAQFCDPNELPRKIVTVGAEVSYRLGWGPASAYYRLVYPEEFTGAPDQISLLSPIGVALLGLRLGDRMPVFIPGEGFQVIEAMDLR
jgi:regulator of nucleoside diphosphate kinase